MTWNYGTQPWNFTPAGAFADATSLVDTVRFLIGDTNSADQQLQDGEINGALAQNGVTLTTVSNTNTGPVYLAAIECCRAIIAKYSRQVDKATGGLSLSASQRAKAFKDLLISLEKQSLRHITPVPYLGGISQSDMEIDEEDDDLVQHQFKIGQMDDPGGAPDFGGTTTFTGAAP